jgi:hypothetical protein
MFPFSRTYCEVLTAPLDISKYILKQIQILTTIEVEKTAEKPKLLCSGM